MTVPSGLHLPRRRGVIGRPGGGSPGPRRVHGDRGMAATELAIVMPALLLLVLVSVHVGLWFHARSLVTAASQEGARAARAAGANDTDGTDRARQFLAGTTAVTDPAVTVTRTGGTVTVTVSGHSPAVIPGVHLDVSAATTSPVEALR